MTPYIREEIEKHRRDHGTHESFVRVDKFYRELKIRLGRLLASGKPPDTATFEIVEVIRMNLRTCTPNVQVTITVTMMKFLEDYPLFDTSWLLEDLFKCWDHMDMGAVKLPDEAAALLMLWSARRQGQPEKFCFYGKVHVSLDMGSTWAECDDAELNALAPISAILVNVGTNIFINPTPQVLNGAAAQHRERALALTKILTAIVPDEPGPKPSHILSSLLSTLGFSRA